MTHRSAGKELHATAAPYVPSPAMWQDMYGAGPMATFDPNMAGMAIMPDTAVPLTMYAAVPPGMTIEVYDAEVKANVNIPAECLFTTYGGLSAVQQGRNAGAKPKVCASFVASSCRAGDSCRDIHTMPQALMAERSRIYTWMHTKEAEFINHPEATYKVFYSDLKEVISVPASALVFTRGLFLDPLDREKRPSGGASHGGRNGNPTVAQQAPTACGLFAANPASCKWGRFCNQAHVSSSWIEDHRKHFEEWSSTLESEFNMLSPDTTFTIHDPLRRALIRVPKDRIATFTRGLLQGTTDKCPSVCLLSLNGRCTAGGRCNQAHVEPKWLSEQTDQSESMVESTAVGSRNHSDNSISDSRQGSMQSIGAASSPPLSRPPNNAAHHHHHQHHHHQHHHQQRGVPLQQDGMMVQAAFPPVEMMFFPHRHHHHHHHHMQSHSHMQTQMLQQHEAYMMQQQQHHHDTMMQQQHLQAQQEAAYLASQQQQQQQAQHDGGRRAVAPPPPVDTNVNHSPPQQYTNNHNVPVPIGHSSPPSPIHQRFSQNPSRHAPPNLTLSNALAPATPPDAGMPSAPQSVGLSPIRPPGSNRGGGAIAPPQFTNNTNYGAMRTPDTLGYGFAPFDMPNTPNVMPRTPLTGGGGRGGGSLNFSFPAPSAIGQGAISPLLRSTTGPSALRVSLTGFEDVFRDGFLGGDGPGDSLTALPPSLSAAQNRPPAAPRGGSNDPSNSSSQHPLLEGGLASLTSPPQSGYMPDNAPTTPLSLKSPSRVAPRNPRYSPATRPSLLTPVETSPPGS